MFLITSERGRSGPGVERRVLEAFVLDFLQRSNEYYTLTARKVLQFSKKGCDVYRLKEGEVEDKKK
jgi:hypothetical protein